MRLLTVGTAALLLAAAASAARANAFDADLSLGYSQLRIDGPNAKDLDKRDGFGAQFSFMFPAPKTPSFRYGFGLNASGFRNDFHVFDPDRGREVHRFDEFSLIVPELRIGYYIPIDHFFIEPSVGLGLAVGDYSTGRVHHHHHHDDDDVNDDFDDVDTSTVRLNAAVHPTIQVGYGYEHWAVGLEASYLYTHLHFKEGIGGDIGELYTGVFFRFSY